KNAIRKAIAWTLILVLESPEFALCGTIRVVAVNGVGARNDRVPVTFSCIPLRLGCAHDRCRITICQPKSGHFLVLTTSKSGGILNDINNVMRVLAITGRTRIIN